MSKSVFGMPICRSRLTFFHHGEDQVASRRGRFGAPCIMLYFSKKNASCEPKRRHLRATAQLRRVRFNFCYKRRQRRVLRRRNAPNSSHSTLISEILIFATFFDSESPNRVGGRLHMAPCFSAKVENDSYLRRFSHLFFGPAKSFGTRIVILVYINIYKYIFIYENDSLTALGLRPGEFRILILIFIRIQILDFDLVLILTQEVN